jgi:hypothetical protein
MGSTASETEDSFGCSSQANSDDLEINDEEPPRPDRTSAEVAQEAQATAASLGRTMDKVELK